MAYYQDQLGGFFSCFNGLVHFGSADESKTDVLSVTLTKLDHFHVVKGKDSARRTERSGIHTLTLISWAAERGSARKDVSSDSRLDVPAIFLDRLLASTRVV
jgi:hypothetical protein